MDKGKDRASEEEDRETDDDVIEILDSPVKPMATRVIKSNDQTITGEQRAKMAPVFAMTGRQTQGEYHHSKSGGDKNLQQQSSMEDSSISTLAHKAKRKQNDLDSEKSVKKQRTDPLKAAQPLAERLRPTTLEAYIGQTDLVGQGSLLRSMLEPVSNASLQSHNSATMGSIILWGPPGCGKTTMARLIANRADADFRELSATSSGTGDVRKVFEQAKNQLKLTGRRTILFIDEIHRFTKPQQDLFLPFVETGSVTLIGATTENPSFKVNGALLSRCRVFTLTKLSPTELEKILQNALDSFPQPLPRVPSKLLPFLADVSDGDARQALNSLELAMSVCYSSTPPAVANSGISQTSQSSSNDEQGLAVAAQQLQDDALMDAIKRGLRKGYDRTGEERYDMISALHKSIRGSDGSAAMYWLARMLEGGEDPLYVARRLVVVASEDVGLADPHGLPIAMATHQACQVIGMPECRINLAHCVAYLSEAKKSIRAYEAYGKAAALTKETPLPGVPLQIRNAPTGLMKSLGYGKEYSYNPGYRHPVHNEYLPPDLAHLSSYGTDHLLKSAEEYENGDYKLFDESKLREWEWKSNHGQEWSAR